MSRSNLSRCWHCLCCSGGCPFAQDMDLGLKMLSKRKLDFMPSKVKNKKQVQDLFELAKELS